jgi:KilA-N domain
MKYLENRNVLTPQRWIDETGAIGLISKSGRYGGTWAHSDIALNFCYWLSPPFQVYFIKEFQRLKKEEFSLNNLEWHVERITNLVDEARNWLDTMPGQKPDRNRLLLAELLEGKEGK